MRQNAHLLPSLMAACALVAAVAALPLGASGAIAATPAVASGPFADPQVGPNAAQQQQFGPTYGALHPSVVKPMTVATDTTAGTPKEVFGFAPYWELWDWQEWQYPLLSTVAYFSVNLNANGTAVTTDSNWSGYQSSNLTSMVSAAHAAGDHVLLTITDMSSSSIETIASNPTYTQNAIQTAISLARAKNMDGVTVDFEGQGCAGTVSAATAIADNCVISSDFTSFIQQLSAAVYSQIDGGEVVVATYGGAAATNQSMFNISALSPYVNAFFVMAYDMNFSNNAGYVQAAATAPLNSGNSSNPNYPYSDTNVVNCYLGIASAAMGSCPDSTIAGKIILGVPYYGYKWSVNSGANSGPPPPNATISSPYNMEADTYSNIQSDFACADKLSANNWDSTAQTPWAYWWSPATNDPCGANYGSWRELYYDNAQSLALKYQLVNSSGIAGVGIWALGYDSGYTALWDALAQNINVQHTPVGAVTPFPLNAAGTGSQSSTTCFTVSWGPAPGSIPAENYIIWVQDGQTGVWQKWLSVSYLSAPFCGFRNNTYYFYAQAQGMNKAWSPGPPPPGQTTGGEAGIWIIPGATLSMGFTGMYGVDAYGNIDPGSSPPLTPTGTWSYPIVTGIGVAPDGQGGYTLDGYGGLHPFGNAPYEAPTGYWPGWNIARGVAVGPSGTSGYVVDGYGGVHPFGGAPPVTVTGYWHYSVVVGLALCPDGTSGFTVDAEGGVHPFGTPGNIPALPAITGHWNYNVVVGIAVNSTCNGGYTLDEYGGIHPFGTAPYEPPSAYFSTPMAKGVVMIPGSTSEGYVLDSWGGFHPFGGAPAVFGPIYVPGNNSVAVAIGSNT